VAAADTQPTAWPSYESMRCAKDGTLVYIDSQQAGAPCAGQPESFCGARRTSRRLLLRDAKLVEARFDGMLESCRTPSCWPMRPAAWCWPTARPMRYSAMRTAPCAAWCSSI
jgi:hypothetical protein